MSPQEYTPGSVIEDLALFPLPSAVLFPGMQLPLHIFELRYRAMTEHVLSGSRQIAVVLLENGPSDSHGQPAIAQVAGVGEIVHHQALSDGRYNILLSGKARVELRELPFAGPFRRARAQVLPSAQGVVNSSEVAALVFGATRLAALLRQRESTFDLKLPNVQDAAATVDACAHQLVVEAEERQELLETLDLSARVRRCIEILAVQSALLQSQSGAPS
jgi:Lon protease-like protein